MKYWFCLLLLTGCKLNSDTKEDQTTHTAVQGNYTCDSLRFVVDSLKKKLFVANFKVERVKYYLNIANNNPSQSKFLKGWLMRAVKDSM